MRLLRAVASLALPDCYIAAGFVRNMVWDHLHGYAPTQLNDVDVICFDPANAVSPRVTEPLYLQEPSVRWEVKNQATMHTRNHDPPYTNSAGAMRYWPEKETAVGVRLKSSGAIEVAAPFGLDSLFAGCISHNPKRSKSLFLERVAEKQWLETWPLLRLVV